MMSHTKNILTDIPLFNLVIVYHHDNGKASTTINNMSKWGFLVSLIL